MKNGCDRSWMYFKEEHAKTSKTNAIDSCLSDSCYNGSCYNTENGYECLCHTGYTGTHCNESLQDQNKGNCASSPCLNEGTCINAEGGHFCNCRRGFYGSQCQFGCGFRELGIRVPGSRRIPDSDITASSQRVEGRSAFRGRIGVETIGDWEDGWCAAVSDTAPHFQVFFGFLTNVTVVETEGVIDGNTDAWVESYYVSTSNSSDPESFVNYTEGGETKIFKANDNILGKKNVSLNGTSAHYIRIHPVSFIGTSACLRIALYVCDSEDFPSLGNPLQSVGEQAEKEESTFDTRYLVIPAALLFGLLLVTALLLCLRYSRKFPRKGKGYSEFNDFDDEGIDETVLYDVPMYEVQTVTIEMGPEKLIRENGKGVWQEITLSESLQVQQKYHNAIYDRVDIDIIEYETETETDAACT
ncbi:uncharacterized protein [Montipora capricornis]|uniref:uncharacterized protein n=1 Tax=Montipora capricornis TaxID=246305 RepID=UPI0035F12827